MHTLFYHCPRQVDITSHLDELINDLSGPLDSPTS